MIYSDILNSSKSRSAKKPNNPAQAISIDSKFIEPIERVYKDLVDFCQDQVHHYALKTSYTSGEAAVKVGSSLLEALGFSFKKQDGAPSTPKSTSIDLEKLYREAELLRDYYVLLNTLLAFGAISLFKDHENLSLLSKMGVNTVKMNSQNQLLAHMLGVSQMISDQTTKNQSKLNMKIVGQFFSKIGGKIRDTLVTNFQSKGSKSSDKKKPPTHFGEGEDEELEEDFFNGRTPNDPDGTLEVEDDKLIQQHPVIRNCLLLQRKLYDAIFKTTDSLNVESQIKVQACRLLNRIFDMR